MSSGMGYPKAVVLNYMFMYMDIFKFSLTLPHPKKIFQKKYNT